MVPPNWEAAQAEDFLGRWAMKLMLINVSTRRFGRTVRSHKQLPILRATLASIQERNAGDMALEPNAVAA
jgi:hypothetical protein